MAGGDDPTSSRFYDNLVQGSVSIILSDGFYDQGAPFRCAVPYSEMAFFLNEIDFQGGAHRYMKEALDSLFKGNAALLQRKWESQRKHAADLLWHIPGSRVAQNVLEDVYRRCLTDLRGNNDGA